MLALGLLLPLAPLQAQSPAADQGAYQRALETRAQWAGNGFSAEDLRVTNAYTEANGLEHVYVQQQHRGIPVYNRVLSLAFLRGRLVHHAGTFVPTKGLAALAATPTLSAAGAVSRAVRHVAPTGSGEAAPVRTEGGPEARQTFAAPTVAEQDIVASLTWVLDPAGRPHLAWNVNIDLLHAADWWNVQVDAATGVIISQDNWTVEEHGADLCEAAPAQPSPRRRPGR